MKTACTSERSSVKMESSLGKFLQPCRAEARQLLLMVHQVFSLIMCHGGDPGNSVKSCLNTDCIVFGL